MEVIGRHDLFIGHAADNAFDPDAAKSNVIQYHIHVNCFGRISPPSLLDRVDGRQLKGSRCKFFGGESPSDLWILTAKIARIDDADALLERIVGLLRDEAAMRGYVECEAVNIDDIRRYPVSDFRQQLPFPDLGIHFRPGRRVADIHVFRPIGAPLDNLDASLAASGFYKVTSTRERIWTLLAGDMRSAKTNFEALHRFFSVTGGVSKLELETVRELVPVPEDFPLAQVCFPALECGIA